jgi:DNA primase
MMADDKEIKFLFLPTEHDPDSFVRERGAPAFEEAIRQAMPLSSFLIQVANEGHDWNTPEGRAQTQHTAKPLLLSMPAIALRAQLIRELAQRIGITPAELESFCGFKPVVEPKQMTPVSNTGNDKYMNAGSNGKKPWAKKTPITSTISKTISIARITRDNPA